MIALLFLLIFKFQSALPRGERLYLQVKRILHQYFNPRSREGSDIHLLRSDSPSSDFNPRSREGSDGVYLGLSDRGALFQSTLPRGERRHLDIYFHCANKFQSALPRGERPRYEFITAGATVFQSALPRGERLHISRPVFPSQYFNPRSREGSDLPILLDLHTLHLISIRAPARGATFPSC